MDKRSNDVTKSKRARSSRYPGRPLSEAVDMVRKLDGLGGKTDTSVLALALDMSPKASSFLRLLAATRYFGLTQREGKTISLSALGRHVAVPVSTDEEKSAIREAFLNAEPFARTMEQFEGRTLPRQDVFRNFLRRTFNLTPAGAKIFERVFVASAQTAGVVQEREGEMVVIHPEEPAVTPAEFPSVESLLTTPILEEVTEYAPPRKAVTIDLERIRLEVTRDLIAKIPDFDSNWTADNIKLVRDMIFELMDRLEEKEGTKEEPIE